MPTASFADRDRRRPDRWAKRSSAGSGHKPRAHWTDAVTGETRRAAQGCADSAESTTPPRCRRRPARRKGASPEADGVVEWLRVGWLEEWRGGAAANSPAAATRRAMSPPSVYSSGRERRSTGIGHSKEKREARNVKRETLVPFLARFRGLWTLDFGLWTPRRNGRT